MRINKKIVVIIMASVLILCMVIAMGVYQKQKSSIEPTIGVSSEDNIITTSNSVGDENEIKCRKNTSIEDVNTTKVSNQDIAEEQEISEPKVEEIKPASTDTNKRAEVDTQTSKQNNTSASVSSVATKKTNTAQTTSALSKTSTKGTSTSSKSSTNSSSNNAKAGTSSQNKASEVNISTKITEPQTKKVEETKPAEEKKLVAQEPVVQRCTNNNNHGMNVGNCNQWFISKSEAVAEYNAKVKYWGSKWEKFEIENDEYYKNCPSGYETWSCPYCNKWTINYYYR